MLRQLDFRQLNKNDWTLPRAAVDVMSVMPTVQTVCEDVRVRGIQAVLDYSEKFDSVRPEFLSVEVEALHAALDAGAWGAWLSGSGPTMACACAPADVSRIQAAMPAGGDVRVTSIDDLGATVG